MSYQIKEINQQIIQILDSYNGCIYIIKGQKKSLVIDLGMDNEPIKPLLESYISTPYDVICTHGHIDHVGRSGEFDNIYMSYLDKQVYLDNYKMNDPQDRFNILGLSLIDIENIKAIPNQFHLGDRIIHIINCFGHTPGSILVVDEKNKVVLTGDAIGSGCGVWMQVVHALSIKEYYHSLNQCLDKLQTLNVDEQWLFLGGHANQEYQSKVSEYNKLDINLLKDMIKLCNLLINHQIDYKNVHTREFPTGQPYYASYHKAEMIFPLSQLE